MRRFKLRQRQIDERHDEISLPTQRNNAGNWFQIVLLKGAGFVPFYQVMLKPILQSGLAGLSAASQAFDRDAAQIAQLGATTSEPTAAATVRISPEARAGRASEDADTSLEGAMVDSRIAKYSFMANLKTLQTGDEMADELTKLGQKS